MAYSTTELNKITKETLDSVIHETYDFNMQSLKKIKRVTATEPITGLGRVFTLQTKSNQSYGSMGTEGAGFPAAGALDDQRATVNYRRQFSSFFFTGDVEDLATNKTLADALERITKDTTQSFDEKQNFFFFGDGNGVLAQIDSVSSNDITCLNNVTYAHGARAVMAGQLLNAYDVSGTAYRSGDMVVSSVNRSTDVVTVDAAAAAIANDDDDVLVFKQSYGFAPQGCRYHVADSGTWLTLSRTTYPSLKSVVHDAASASVDWDMIDIALLKSRNARGDAAPKFDYMLVGHPVQHKNLRAQARSNGNTQFETSISGTAKADLGIRDISINGMNLEEDSWCAPSDMWGLRLEDWAIEEAAPRQLYKHGDGDIFIQSLAASTQYADQKEGRVYWRYNFVCKKPYRQFRVKNINFSTDETRTQRQ